MALQLRNRPTRRAVAAFAASGLLFSGSAALLAPGTGMASSHREAPLVANDPQVDTTDVYAFVSPDKPDMTTLVTNVIPFEEPAGGPLFYPFAADGAARYNFKIDNNGDAKTDITYRYTFKNVDRRDDVDYPGTDADGSFIYNNGPVNSVEDKTLLFKQTYTLQRIDSDGAKTLVKDGVVAPSNVGKASMPNYAALRDEAIEDVAGGGKSFAGQADDPFFIDLRIFDLLYGGDLSETGNNTTAGFNVNTMALQVPTEDLTRGGDPVIGVHATVERPSTRVQGAGTQKYDGKFVQVSRQGNPLVNEINPIQLKDAFNSLAPENDASVPLQVAKVNDPEVPKLVEAVYGIKQPKAPREDLFAVFLTGIEGLNKPKGKVQPAELLRLNTAIKPSEDPNRLGVLAKDLAGFPNGRRLTDDVVDIGLQALEGAVRTGKIVEPLAAGDRVDRNDKAFGDSFPYVSLPHSGSSVRGRSSGSTQSPRGGVDAGAGGTVASGTPATEGSSPLLPLSAAGLGAGFALLGAGLLRRGRTAPTQR